MKKIKIPEKIIAKVFIEFIHMWTYIKGYISILLYKIVYKKNVFFIGSNFKVWGSVIIKIIGEGSIKIGKNAHLVSDPKRSYITLFSKVQLTAYDSGKIEISDNVALNGTTITSKKYIKIGQGTMIAPNVIIVDSDFHQIWPSDKRFISSTSKFDKKVDIGKNVWIGMNSTILKGSIIGDNSIIGAGSVVSGIIPANCLAYGSPAKFIKTLDD